MLRAGVQLRCGKFYGVGRGLWGLVTVVDEENGWAPAFAGVGATALRQVLQDLGVDGGVW